MAEQQISAQTRLLLTQFWNVDTIMLEWQKAHAALTAAKATELALRNAVFELKFPTFNEGTNRVALGNGYFLKAVAKTNYTINMKDGAAEAALTQLEKTGNEGKFLADRIFKWSADLVLSEYRKLAPAYKTIIDTVLTTSPGTPALEIEPPK